MRYLIIISILLFSSRCGDQKAPLPTITGQWYSLLPSHPNWLYDFRNGILTQSVTDFGAVLSTKQYPYTERGDTVYIGGDLNEPQRKWLITWESPDIIHIQAINAQINNLQYLKRIQY